MKSTCFLFGAGAEYSFKLGDGESFARNVVGNGNQAMNSAIREYYRSLDLLDEWYPKYKNSKVKTIDLIEAALKKKKYTLNEEYKPTRKFSTQLRREAERYENSPQERKELLNKWTSYFGIIDESFCTLMSPKHLGPEKFWRVVNFYTRAYLFMVLPFLSKDKSKDTYLEALRDPKGTYIKVLNEAKGKLTQNDNYYSYLRAYFPSAEIATTNYTPFCDIISDGKAAYLHGKLNLFECPRTLKVVDVTTDDVNFGKDVYFPYLFIQSGVKPIVEKKQIEEYHKFVKQLKKSKELVILGYNLNFDDNHLNGLIRDFLLTGRNRLVYFDYNCDSKDMIKNRLRIDKEDADKIMKRVEYIIPDGTTDEEKRQSMLDKFKEYLIRKNQALV